MSDGIAAVMSRISQIRSALGGGGGGVLGVANTGDARFSDALSKASGDANGAGAGTTKTGSGAGAADPLERAAISAKVARTARPLGAKPAGWPEGVPPEAEAYAAEFEAAAAATGVPIEVLLAVAWAESGFNPDAVSSAGAQGMMQLMPATGEGMGVTDPFDAGQNILGGAHYLKVQYERFGSWDLAFAAYNAGPGAVQQYGGVPPYPETRSYVDILNGYLEQMTPTSAGTPGLTGTPGTSAGATANGSGAQGHERVLHRLSAAGGAPERTAPLAVMSNLTVGRLDHLPLNPTLTMASPDPLIAAALTPIGMAPAETTRFGMVPAGMEVEGTGINGLGADVVNTARGLPANAQPTQTPTLTSTVAALPESLVALIQRSQSGGQGTQRLTVRLDPPELGRLDVSFEVRGDQVAVVVRPESAGAGQLMSHQRNRIAEILAQQGLQLSGFDVATGGGERNPDRRSGPLSRAYPAHETDPIDLVQLTVDRALRL